jgi:hypothetical protein
MLQTGTSHRAAWIVLALLVLVRVPSLVQPAGADQDLYAYVGQEILRGGLPYRDAWDQKPPAVHYTYAALFALWPHESVIPAADLAAAIAVALMLLALERRLTASSGFVSPLLFLLLGNPAFSRLGGIRIRGQCEAFIAVATTGALLLLWQAIHRSRRGAGWRRPMLLLAAGLLLGVAFTFKYNAGIYAASLVAASLAWRHQRRGEEAGWMRLAATDTAWMAAGSFVPVVVLLGGLTAAGVGPDLWDATVTYNLLYSGETYGGLTTLVTYALTFPVQQARVDGLWLLGGAGCLVLLTRLTRDASAWVALAAVAAACLSIVVNGGRGLPQYFVQANPALALAAGMGAVAVWGAWRKPAVRAALLIVVALALSRVVQAEKAIDYTLTDAKHMIGLVPRDEYLVRFGGQRATDKHAPIAVRHLARYVRTHAGPEDRVLVFGFSQGALVQAERRSATRFFWSRPLIVGFNEGRPGYGAAGLLDELLRTAPVVVALQASDWQFEGTDSAGYFLGHEVLSAWLRDGYERQTDLHAFQIWLRKAP